MTRILFVCQHALPFNCFFYGLFSGLRIFSSTLFKLISGREGNKDKATDYSFYERLGMSDTHTYITLHGNARRARAHQGRFYFVFFFYSGKTLGVFFFYLLVSFVYTLLIVYFCPGREKKLYLFDE